MSKKIYQVFDSKLNKVVDEGFASRSAAKTERDTLNGEDGTRFVVNRGADHPRGQSNGLAEQSKRWL